MIDDLDSVLREFYEENKNILNRTVCERALVFRLGLILQKKFQQYFVDCEFNRNGEIPKSITNKQINFPDLIVHKRNDNTEDNLLIVEVKTPKYVNEKSMKNDIDKLKGFTNKRDNYRYHFAAHILLSKKKFILVLYTPSENTSYQITYYKVCGEHLEKCSEFRNAFIKWGAY